MSKEIEKSSASKNMKTVALNGLSRRAQVASVLAANLFDPKKVIFDVDSKEDVTALVEKMVTDLVDEANDTAKTSPRPPCVVLPKHVALAFLDITSASALDLFFLAKEAMSRNYQSHPKKKRT